MDSRADELAQLAADAEALQEASEQASDQTLLGLAESVMQVNQANVATNRSLRVALASIEAAPDRLALSLESSLKQLEEQRQVLRAQTAKFKAQTRFNWAAIAGGLLIVGGATFLLPSLYLLPKIDEYKAYAQDHRALEVDSVFGARVVENESGEVFVVFDEGVVVKGTCTVPNCVSIQSE